MVQYYDKKPLPRPGSIQVHEMIDDLRFGVNVDLANSPTQKTLKIKKSRNFFGCISAKPMMDLGEF